MELKMYMVTGFAEHPERMVPQLHKLYTRESLAKAFGTTDLQEIQRAKLPDGMQLLEITMRDPEPEGESND